MTQEHLDELQNQFDKFYVTETVVGNQYTLPSVVAFLAVTNQLLCGILQELKRKGKDESSVQ